MNLYIALLHYPVIDKRGDLVATSITNFDIHDIARTAKTFGVKKYYIVTGIKSQLWLADRIIKHWQEGFGSRYNPTRKEALDIVKLVRDIDEIIDDIQSESDRDISFVATSAKTHAYSHTFGQMRKKLRLSKSNFCVLFGTGWGFHPSLMSEVDYILDPIEGAGDYNHLSVRSAVAIILDRLVTERAPVSHKS